MVTAELDVEDLKKVAEIDPSLIKKKWAMVQLPVNELQDPNSEGYQKIIHLCQVVSQLGKYGEINQRMLLKRLVLQVHRKLPLNVVRKLNRMKTHYGMNISRNSMTQEFNHCYNQCILSCRWLVWTIRIPNVIYI